MLAMITIIIRRERVRFEPVESYDLEDAGANDTPDRRLRNSHRDYYERS